MGTRPFLAFVAGFVLALLLSGLAHTAQAQATARMYGTLSGDPIAIQADSSGYVKVQAN
jgi:hypothetical protein